MSSLPPFLSLSVAETEALLTELGTSPRHAKPLRRALLFGHSLRETKAPDWVVDALGERVRWLSCESVEQLESADGSVKHVVRLEDGKLVETVHLPGALTGAPSACISSQVGCAMACSFCATGLDKVARNLAAHEILEQVVLLRRLGPVRRLVFMGAGEPTQNLRNVAAALAVLRDEAEIGPKKIMVSTVGPASAVDRLAALGLRFTLALSLHTANHAKRAALIPTQKKVVPTDLLDAADRFSVVTRRAYQVEYVLLGGVNDSEADAVELAAALKGRRLHVSVIRWNPVDGMEFQTPSTEAARAFVTVLHRADISAQLRRTVGQESAAACGQLRASRLERGSEKLDRERGQPGG